jgi:chromosome partitioning protein
MGINRANLDFTSADLFFNNIDIRKIICKLETIDVDILPARFELNNIESQLITQENKDFKLRNALDTIKGDYDYILLDCPPSLGIVTMNALVAADSVLIPVQCEFLALDGLTQLLNTIRVVQNKQKLNGYPSILIEGVLLTMLDTRSNIGYEVINEVKTYFKEKVFSTIIPRNVRISEASSHGVPVTEYAPYSKGSVSYKNLAKEIVKNHGE